MLVIGHQIPTSASPWTMKELDTSSFAWSWISHYNKLHSPACLLNRHIWSGYNYADPCSIFHVSKDLNATYVLRLPHRNESQRGLHFCPSYYDAIRRHMTMSYCPDWWTLMHFYYLEYALRWDVTNFIGSLGHTVFRASTTGSCYKTSLTSQQCRDTLQRQLNRKGFSF